MFKGRDHDGKGMVYRALDSRGTVFRGSDIVPFIIERVTLVLPFKPAHKVSLQSTDVGLGRQETYFLYLQRVHTLHCAGCNYHHIGLIVAPLWPASAGQSPAKTRQNDSGMQVASARLSAQFWIEACAKEHHMTWDGFRRASWKANPDPRL